MSKNLSTPGLPDLMGWIPGVYPSGVRPLFIEVKRPGGVRRPAQTYFIEEAKSDGCVAFFAESWRGCIDEFAKIGITLRED